MGKAQPFRRKRPCDTCPFRSSPSKGGELFEGLHPDRVTEIADSLKGDSVFHCHKSVNYDADDGEPTTDEASHACAGAVATMARSGELNGNLSMRLAQMLGYFTPEQFHPDTAPVYDSLSAWEKALRERYTHEE